MKQEQLNEMIAMLERLHSSMFSLVEGLSDRQINWRPIETENSVGILAHHIADTERWLIGKFFGGQEVNHEHEDAFRRSNTTTDEVMENMRSSFANSIEILNKTDPATLSEPGMGNFTKLQTLNQALIHLAHHRGYAAMIKRMGHMM